MHQMQHFNKIVNYLYIKNLMSPWQVRVNWSSKEIPTDRRVTPMKLYPWQERMQDFTVFSPRRSRTGTGGGKLLKRSW